jgi:hypothetical protein
MSYAKKPKLRFFRENWPGDHDLDGKKPRLRFFVNIDSTTMISAENTEILFFVKFNPTAMRYAEKIQITFFH